MKEVVRNMILVILGTAILFSFSCSSSVENAEQLKEYMVDKDNGLLKSKKIGEVEISALIKPSDLLVSQELGDKNDSEDLIDSLSNKYDPYLYMVLSMSGNGKEIESYKAGGVEFSERVQTLSFRMRDYVTLVNDTRDTIPILDYSYQRMFGVGGASEMLFVFDKSEVEKAETITLKVRDIGLGIGTTKLKFDKKSIDNIPEIKF